jgi:hypothetical protein
MTIDEYSIEVRAAGIYDARTREYFAEVRGGYEAGNYRSAVVMLWSVAVCDLIFKLESLKDLYSDKAADDILGEISKIQEEADRSSAWEKKLLDLVFARTNLLDAADFENLSHLQRQRHLSAHPVINSGSELHRPNRETARALIRNTLDGVLTKAPILSKKVFEQLVADLEENTEVFVDDQMLKTFLAGKYFSKLTPQVGSDVFRSLWRIVFGVDDERCSKNRDINFRALRLLFSTDPARFVDVVSVASEFFSKLAKDPDAMPYLVRLLAAEPRLYAPITDPSKVLIRAALDGSVDLRFLGWFQAENMEAHAKSIEDWIPEERFFSVSADTWEMLRDASDSDEWTRRVVGLAISHYATSANYDTADQRFSTAITPLLGDFRYQDCITLIERIQENDQTYGRGRAYSDHRRLRARTTELDATFNPAAYDRFNRHLD